MKAFVLVEVEEELELEELIEDEIFDVVVIANALHIMPQPEKALNEIHRVLKKDGILFAPTFVYERGYPKLPIWLMEKAGFKTYHKWQSEEL